jgi:hypothetical protein
LQFNKQKAHTQKEVNFVSMFDGVEETGRCNGGLVVEGYKHTIFFQSHYFLSQK